MDFNERHYGTGQRAIWPNQCIPWMMLSFDERIKVVENNQVFCKYCLRFLTISATSNSCGKGKHIQGNGKNGSCTVIDCENNVTLCKKHETVELNLESRTGVKTIVIKDTVVDEITTLLKPKRNRIIRPKLRLTRNFGSG